MQMICIIPFRGDDYAYRLVDWLRQAETHFGSKLTLEAPSDIREILPHIAQEIEDTRDLGNMKASRHAGSCDDLKEFFMEA